MVTIAILGVPTVAVLLFTWFDRGSAADPPAVVARKVEATPAPAPAARRDITVAVQQWTGHLALVVGNGGLTTQAGSPAAAEGLDLEIRFIGDAPSKHKAPPGGEGV